eukprot:6207798-Pleurochrysis_carterae.AAC.1
MSVTHGRFGGAAAQSSAQENVISKHFTRARLRPRLRGLAVRRTADCEKTLMEMVGDRETTWWNQKAGMKRTSPGWRVTLRAVGNDAASGCSCGRRGEVRARTGHASSCACVHTLAHVQPHGQ